MLCACVAGSSTPVTRIFAVGNAAANSAMNGIEPPIPVSIGVVPPRWRNAGARGVVDRSAGVDRVRLTHVAGGDGDPRAPRRVLLRGDGSAPPGARRRRRPARRAC